MYPVDSHGYSSASHRFCALTDCSHQLWHHFEQIANQPVIRDLEDRRIGILVDGDDDLRFLHPGQMLDRPGDADGDVKLRRDDLAGLADLVVVRHEAGIDGGTGGAEGGTELVGKRFEQLVVVLATAQATTTGDDDLGGPEFRAFGLGQFAVGELGLVGVGCRRRCFRFRHCFRRSTASKAVVRTVMTLTWSALLTVARALPA